MKAELEALLERLEKIDVTVSEPIDFRIAIQAENLIEIQTIVRELINILMKQDEVHSRV